MILVDHEHRTELGTSPRKPWTELPCKTTSSMSRKRHDMPTHNSNKSPLDTSETPSSQLTWGSTFITVLHIGCPGLRSTRVRFEKDDGSPSDMPYHTGHCPNYPGNALAISTEETVVILFTWFQIYKHILREEPGTCHRADTKARRVRHANRGVQ